MASKNSREERRAAAAAALRAQQRREKRRTYLIQAAVGLVAVGIVAAAAVTMLNNRDQREAAAAGQGAAPAQVDADGAFVVGEDDAPVTIQIVEDFQCPVCRQFEEISGALIDSYIADGTAQVQYRTIAFLDRASTTRYSTRALNASACVMDSGEEVWREFHRQLFAQQPAEGTAGLPDDDLVDIAEQAGATDVGDCIRDETYTGWTVRTTDAAGQDGINATPTVFVDGQQLPDFAPETIRAAVEKAQAS
ncbi:DsbA family protein [Nocardioides sp.]|uniref:DsbA family protein n=1 Tax=Nocardioides sp. TaxID=35761 RepID=UPI003512D45A